MVLPSLARQRPAGAAVFFGRRILRCSTALMAMPSFSSTTTSSSFPFPSASSCSGGLASFIEAAKQYTEALSSSSPSSSSSSRPPHAYLGNEAGDADSLVSAICYAFLGGALDEAGSYAHVPLLSISRGELALRPETVELMNIAGLEISALDASLQYYDDERLSSSSSSSSPSTVLELLGTAEPREKSFNNKFFNIQHGEIQGASAK